MAPVPSSEIRSSSNREFTDELADAEESKCVASLGLTFIPPLKMLVDWMIRGDIAMVVVT